jgi:hypothetical protein
MPQISDPVRCSSIFEIRDSQAANSNVNRFAPAFGNNGMAKHNTPTNPETENPGPPFHVGRANLNLVPDADPRDPTSNSFSYLGGADSPQYNLPNRNRPNRSGQFGGNRMMTLAESLSPAGSEADRSPNMNNDHQSTRSSSYKDSSSHTSFTPPSISDETRHNSVNTVNTNSAASPLTTTPNSNDATATMADGNIFSMDANFSNFQPGFLGQPLENTPGAFAPFGSGWEMSGIEITSGTGMTPMPWNDMLDGMNTNWGGSGNTGFIGEERRGN